MLLFVVNTHAARIKFKQPPFSKECITVFQNIDTLKLSQIPKKCQLTKKLQLWRKLRKHELSFEQGVRFIQENPHWPLRSETIPELEKTILKTSLKSVVRKWFLTHPPQTPHGVLSFVETLSLNERKEKKYLKIIKTFWHSQHLSDIDQTIILNKLGYLLLPADHQQRIEFLLWNKQCELAAKLFKYLSQKKQAVYREWAQAINGKKNPNHQNISHPGIATEVAKQAIKHKLYSKAAYYLVGINSKRVFSLETPFYKISTQAIRELINVKQYRLAYRLALKGIETSQNSKPFQEEFQWLSGWILTEFLKQPKNAIKHLVQAASLTQNSRKASQYFFWLSQAANNANMQIKANEWLQQAYKYPHTFYGQLAATHLNKAINIPPPRFSQAAINHFLRKDIVKAIQFAHDTQQDTVKYVLIDALQNNLNTLEEYSIGFYFTQQYATPYYTIHYYEKVNKHINFSTPDVFFNIRCNFNAMFNKHFMHAMIFNESRFHPTIKSGKGALGLMQITPLTGKHLEQKGVSFRETELHQNPLYNLQMGSIYLNELFNRFNKSYIVVAAAYNAGPTYTSRWIRRHGYPKNNLDYHWIERLEYKETRDYVKKIMAAMFLYKTHSQKVQSYSTQQLVQFYLKSR